MTSRETASQRERVTVWCAVEEFGVLGLYFFEDEDGSAVTIRPACYIEMLDNFLQPQLNELAADAEDIWFQQDGATVYTAQEQCVTWELFPRHIISHRDDIPWPARSPDLAPSNFFLWGYLKEEVYKHRPVIWLS